MQQVSQTHLVFTGTIFHYTIHSDLVQCALNWEFVIELCVNLEMWGLCMEKKSAPNSTGHHKLSEWYEIITAWHDSMGLKSAKLWKNSHFTFLQFVNHVKSVHHFQACETIPTTKGTRNLFTSLETIHTFYRN